MKNLNIKNKNSKNSNNNIGSSVQKQFPIIWILANLLIVVPLACNPSISFSVFFMVILGLNSIFIAINISPYIDNVPTPNKNDEQPKASPPQPKGRILLIIGIISMITACVFQYYLDEVDYAHILVFISIIGLTFGIKFA